MRSGEETKADPSGSQGSQAPNQSDTCDWCPQGGNSDNLSWMIFNGEIYRDCTNAGKSFRCDLSFSNYIVSSVLFVLRCVTIYIPDTE